MHAWASSWPYRPRLRRAPRPRHQLKSRQARQSSARVSSPGIPVTSRGRPAWVTRPPDRRALLRGAVCDPELEGPSESGGCREAFASRGRLIARTRQACWARLPAESVPCLGSEHFRCRQYMYGHHPSPFCVSCSTNERLQGPVRGTLRIVLLRRIPRLARAAIRPAQQRVCHVGYI